MFMELNCLPKNLITLRKNAKLTQAEFAEKINYSDKSVSKWETGEAYPSVDVLIDIANFYGITLNDLFDENVDFEKLAPAHKRGKLLISMLAVSAIWIIACVIFMFLGIFNVSKGWMCFLYAVPASFIIAIVFNSIWGERRWNFVFVSCLIWTTLTCVYLQLLRYNIWLIFTVGIPIQVSLILWSQIKKD